MRKGRFTIYPCDKEGKLQLHKEGYQSSRGLSDGSVPTEELTLDLLLSITVLRIYVPISTPGTDVPLSDQTLGRQGD